jgi:lambda repressor-like predicted transcriptional regulator
VLEKRIILSEPEQRLINSLINKVKQDTTVLENYLEKYAGNTQWIEKNLDLLLTKFEKKRQKVFAKLLNKYLKELSNGYDRKSLRKKLEEEYQRMEKMLKNYIKNSCQENSIQQESSLPIEENSNQELMYVGSVTVMDKNEESYVDSNACSMDANEWLDLNEWLTLQRQTLKKMLKEELPSYDVIQSLLEKNLNRLQLLIDTQLKNHENKINEVRYRRVNYKDALDRSEFLQHRLTYFFRHCSLLFHPDKSHGDERLKLIQTELFKAFQYFAENSLERLSKGLTKLKRYIPKWKLNLDKLLEEAERDRKEFREWMDQKFSELEAENAETRKNQARMQTEINAMETEISVLTKKMNIHMFYSEAKEQGQTWQTLNYSSPRP